MAESLYPYALTSLQRVKDTLWDPNSYLTPTGAITSGSNVVANISTLQGIQIGQSIAGSGIPSGTTVTAVGSSAITLSANATANNSSIQLTIVNQPSAFDTELIRNINGVTDYIERQCARRFLLTQYVNDEMSGVSYEQRRIVLRQYPVFYLVTSGTLANGSNVITAVANTSGVAVGMVVYAPGLVNTGQPGTMIVQPGNLPVTVTAVTTNTITISQNASYSQAGATIQISGLASLEYMSGTPVTNPAWTSYIPDQYKLKDFGRAGIVRVYGYIQRIYDSSIRATYWAGYLINWANAGDNLTHTLPADLTRTAENLVVRRFKRRQTGDTNSQSLGGSSTVWDKDLTTEDKDVINHYKRLPIYF